MFSKLSLFAFMAAEANALITVGSTTYVSGTHADYACGQCIAEDYMYCATDTTYARHASITNTGKCLAKAGSCSNAGIKITNSAELAIMACPTLTTICGATSGTAANQMWTTFAATTDAAVSVQPAADLAQYAACTYGFKATCGAPYVKGTGSFGSNANLALVHYTNDDRISALASDSASTPVVTEFPKIDSTINVLDTNCAVAGQCSAVNQQGSQFVYKKKNTDVIQTDDQLGEYLTYVASTQAYLTAFIDEYRKYSYSKQTDFFQQLLSIMTFGLAAPKVDDIDGLSPTSNYAGNVWKDLTTLGGWGDLSIQSMDGTSAYYYEFGTYGKVQSAPTDATSNAVDTNTAACASRYAVAVMYNGNSAAVTAANAALEGKAIALSSLNGLYAAPTNVATQDSAKWIGGVVAATAAVLATL